jgi:uncharacterized protein YciI
MIKPKTSLLFATILIIGAILAAAASAPDDHAPRSTEQQLDPPPPLYVVEYDVGPAYLPGRPFDEQPEIYDHAEYMNELSSTGVLVMGGPVLADLETFTVSGALLFVKADSLDDARRIVEADPAVTGGFMIIVDVSPFAAMISPF